MQGHTITTLHGCTEIMVGYFAGAAGLERCSKFIYDLHGELQHYHGPGGVTTSSRGVLDNFAKAFHMKTWLDNSTVNDEVVAVRNLWAALHIHLKDTF